MFIIRAGTAMIRQLCIVFGLNPFIKGVKLQVRNPSRVTIFLNDLLSRLIDLFYFRSIFFCFYSGKNWNEKMISCINAIQCICFFNFFSVFLVLISFLAFLY